MTVHPSTSGNKYIITLQNYRSKWVEVKLSNEATAKSIILWLEGVWARIGVSKQLWSDQGSQFQSKEFLDYCKIRGINIHHTKAYHHASNGMIERAHRTIWELLKVDVATDQMDWDQRIEKVL